MIWLLVGFTFFGGPQKHSSDLAHTYSIVAWDKETGEIGAAVQSHWFSVGSLVIWAEAGVGAVATQSFVRVDYGPRGLAAMKSGQKPKAALKALLDEDPGNAVRQVAFIDAAGNKAAHTGSNCIDYFCDRQGDGYSVQANLMLKDTVCDAMAKAFENADGPLASRMLKALQAAQAEGGDIRGKQSAAMKVVSIKKPANPWEGVTLDIRVEDHTEPIAELARLIKVKQAYDFMNRGDQITQHNPDSAQHFYKKAVSMLDGRVEPLFWQAVNLVNTGKTMEALPLFRQVFARDSVWKELTPRLVKAGLLPDDPETTRQILAQ